MMNYNSSIISIHSQGGDWELSVCLNGKLTFLVCFWALPDFFYIHDILNQPTVFFFSGGGDSLPRSSSKSNKDDERVRKGNHVRLQQSDFFKCHSKQYIQ